MIDINPDLTQYSKEQLVQLYVDLGSEEEHIVASKMELRHEIHGRMVDDGEVIGNYQVTKTKTYSFPEVTIEQAKELGATEETKSNKKLKIAFLKGAKIPCNITNSVRVSEIKDKEVQEKGE